MTQYKLLLCFIKSLVILTLLVSVPVYSEEENTHSEKPLDGELLLPDDYSQREKKCMTICKEWGEDCLILQKGQYGSERKCRRVCKSFAEECF
jgi:hypothetical protein